MIRRAFYCLMLAVAPLCVADDDAEGHPLDKRVAALEEKAQSTHAMIDVYVQGSALWDKELNRVYGELRAALPDTAAASLKTAQKQWIVSRDAQYAAIDAIYDLKDGTMYLPMRAAARMKVVRDRALELGRWLDALDG